MVVAYRRSEARSGPSADGLIGRACRAGDGISSLGYGQAAGADVPGEFGCTKPLEMFAQAPGRPAPALDLSAQTAPAQPPPHGRRLSQQATWCTAKPSSRGQPMTSRTR